jgi:transaldolase
MTQSRIERIAALGQSIWLDSIRRSWLDNGQLADMIRRGDIRGVTSNPSIFEQAISGSSDYLGSITSLSWAGWQAEKIFWELATEDIRRACDLFMPLYRDTDGRDGYVSLEENPLIARDTQASVAQAHQLWARIGRPNLLVKIPATQEGAPPCGVPSPRA